MRTALFAFLGLWFWSACGDPISRGQRGLYDLASGDGANSAGPECTSTSDCRAGLCLAGRCCTATACGSECCGGAEVCLFDHCVTPGVLCQTAKDCPSGQYCETGLAVLDGGGIAPSDGGQCTQPLPLAGRCLSLPPVCDVDAGQSADAGCLDPCEYHRPPGPLDAIVEWTWGPKAKQYPNFIDVWSTPAIGRLIDANCDGKVDELDPPNLVFVSGDVAPTNTPRDNGVLRVLDGRTGLEVWSLRAASMGSKGFMGFSIAIGDLDGDGSMDITAVTGEGLLVLVDAHGVVRRTSDKPVAGATSGWGGGLAIADMDGDGAPEIAFGNSVFTTTNGALTRKWVGTGGEGGGGDQQLSTFADVDDLPDGHLELVAGNTVYRSDGTVLWNRNDLPDGFPAVGDLDRDGKPDIVMIANGQAWILDGATGVTKLGPLTIGGTGAGGPPTIADFDGDGRPEIGVAQANFYSVIKPDFVLKSLKLLWHAQNHDLSSSVTGSSVFDFEGDGKAEVIYADECYLWVFDGTTGKVRYTALTTSFTATEASLVADVDGDGRAEIVMVSNGADPGPNGWRCDVAPWNTPDPQTGRPAWTRPPYGPAYRGITVIGDRANAWVGTRTLWNQHTYHVTNICDARDDACLPPNTYGSIPRVEKWNWRLNWLDNFRQNVQDHGIFDAPDAVVSLSVDCTDPPTLNVSVRNIGLASLPPGVNADLFVSRGGAMTRVGSVSTTRDLFPSQTERIAFVLAPNVATASEDFVAMIVVDPLNPKFRECRADNDQSPVARASCLQ